MSSHDLCFIKNYIDSYITKITNQKNIINRNVQQNIFVFVCLLQHSLKFESDSLSPKMIRFMSMLTPVFTLFMVAIEKLALNLNDGNEEFSSELRDVAITLACKPLDRWITGWSKHELV